MMPNMFIMLSQDSCTHNTCHTTVLNRFKQKSGFLRVFLLKIPKNVTKPLAKVETILILDTFNDYYVSNLCWIR